MKILVNWIAYNTDFKKGKVDLDNSPNYFYHKYFFKHDKHILLSSEKPGSLRMALLVSQIKQDFPKHQLEERFLDIKNVIDIKEIKTKIENLLLEFQDDEIDIFFSPGTSIMQVSWFICHTSLNLKTRLIQMIPYFKTKSGKPELAEIDVEKSAIPYTAILKEKNIEKKSTTQFDWQGDYLISKSLKPIYEKAYKIAQTDKVTTLIYGESGTGKEHLAKFIHYNSIRKDAPYIVVNCSAFTDTLLESRLFGHKKGAFTGAHDNQKGVFKLAEHGTVFLDEIGDISPYMQQSLLRVLQQKEIMPIGGMPLKIDVRIITATNKNLIQLCKENKFRWDLFYRLCIAELELPSLQTRGQKEIETMLTYFLAKKKEELNKKSILELSGRLKETLLSYTYPGNIRELENLIETLYVFCETKADVADLPTRIKYNDTDNSLNWRNVEKQHIIKVLKLFNGNQRQAWLALGYGSLNTLKKKIKEYEINLINDT